MMRRLQAWIRSWFAPKPTGAAALMAEMKQERIDLSWDQARKRFAVLVMAPSDRERLWKRAHRGAVEEARLLAGIKQPTSAERQRLDRLIQQAESGR